MRPGGVYEKRGDSRRRLTVPSTYFGTHAFSKVRQTRLHLNFRELSNSTTPLPDAVLPSPKSPRSRNEGYRGCALYIF